MEKEVLTHDAIITPEEYASLPRHEIHLILDNLRSAFNVGSIFRTADAARIAKLHLCGYTASPPHRKLDKTSVGSLPYIEWAHYADTMDAVKELKRQGMPVFALEVTRQSVSLFNYRFSVPVGLVLGNEALGVSESVLRKVDEVLEIPLFGFKNSLNVATSAGIALFEIIRQTNSRLNPIKVHRK